MGTLQIHGIASLVEYGTPEYNKGRENYDKRFPQYTEVFECVDNELYMIKPLVIWNYNPALGEEMYREMLVFDENYLNQIEVYHPHIYAKR